MSGFNGDRGAREAEALMPRLTSRPRDPHFCGGDRCVAKGDEACWGCLGIDDAPQRRSLKGRVLAMWPFRFHRHSWGKWSGMFLVNHTDLDTGRVIVGRGYQQRQCDTCGKIVQRIAGYVPDAPEGVTTKGVPCDATIEPKP